MTQTSVTVGSSGGLEGVQLKFDTLLGVCALLNEDRSVEQILDELLLQARGLVNAEAGTVFVVEEDRLRFVCCQNDARPDLCVAPRPTEFSLAAGFKGIVLPIDNASLAGYAANNGRTLRIDDAYGLPQDSPYQFDRKYDESSGYRTKSLLVLPLLETTGSPVGVLQLINRKSKGDQAGVFTSRDEQIAMALASMAGISVRNAKLRDALKQSHLDTIMRLSTAAEFRDDDTGAHIRRVSMYCETVARMLGLPTERTQLILFAAPMHDIGKLAVPDAILSKPGPLTDDERAVMQTHTTTGARILGGSGNELLAVAERIAHSHHERWDGTGYPRKLAGNDIPIEGRITAVADVFDALTSKRVYKPPFSLDAAYKIIREERGKHFDPDVVDAFFEAGDDVEAIYEAYKV